MAEDALAAASNSHAAREPRVRDHLFPPPDASVPLNLSGVKFNGNASLPGVLSGRFHASEIGQDAWVDRVMGDRPGLFAVESGAFNGEMSSNTLWLERGRGWSCLLVEANPYLVQEVLRRKRRCHVLAGGLSIAKGLTTKIPFMMAGEIGGYTSSLSRWHNASLVNFRRNFSDSRIYKTGNASVSMVPAFPLPKVLHVLGRKTVDYWSLDTEGSEPDILEATIDDIEVGLLSVEWHAPAMSAADAAASRHRKTRLYDLLTSRGFTRVHDGIKDDYYASSAYFKSRGLPFPPRGPPVKCKSRECLNANWARLVAQEAKGKPEALEAMLASERAQ